MKKRGKKKIKKSDRWINVRFSVALFLLVLLTLLVYLFDVPIIKFIENLRTNALNYGLLSVGFASNTLIVLFFLTSLFLWKDHKKRWIFPLWLSSFFSFMVSYLLKIYFQRPRPFQAEVVGFLQIGVYFLKNSFAKWNFSFPSFQAVLAFSALPILNKEYPKFKYIWLIFACFAAFARTYFGLHYLSDILAGAIIGYLIGLGMVKLEGKYEYGLKIRKLLKIKK